ncbi:hypothetical protein LJR168_003903 [Pseudoxanthomonas sp. LjRoot168]|uniref:hypothetical protein n=1 Tax=unclassified Pseudoxanthomonas TaxID=2645906 RepID=UPI003ECF8487
MNIDHLRKQAKNLQKLYPELVANNPAKLTLSTAQYVIARQNGYPNWEHMVKSHTERPTAPATRTASVGSDDLAAYLHFELGPESPGKRTKEAVLCPVNRAYADLLSDEDEFVTELLEQHLDFTGEYRSISPAVVRGLVAGVSESLARCPYALDSHAARAELYKHAGDHNLALALIEPIARQALALLPVGSIHVSYYELCNRSFHRVMHTYVLLLHACDRHDEATAMAKRMVSLWPNDNIGFRHLTSKAKRTNAIASGAGQ